LKILSPKEPVSSLAQTGISVDRISYFYGRKQILKSINFQALPGEVCVILGSNGAGKTTLMRLITGYYLPAEGHVWVGDIDMTRSPLQGKSLIGYLPENFPTYPNLTVQEFLKWSLVLKTRVKDQQAECDRVLDCVGLVAEKRKRIGKLSKGMRQRLSLAASLLGNPPFLVLDEPTSGLDPVQIRQVRNLIRDLKGNRTVLLSTHILAEAAQVADRVVILSAGQVLASGRPQELENAYLGDEVVYRVAFRGERKDIQDRLAQAHQLQGWDWVETASGRQWYEIKVNQDFPEETLIKCLSDVDLKPLEFFRKQMRLEDLFFRAVTQEEA